MGDGLSAYRGQHLVCRNGEAPGSGSAHDLSQISAKHLADEVARLGQDCGQFFGLLGEFIELASIV